MKAKRITVGKRNWGLAVIASILAIFGMILCVLAVIDAASLGWWSLLIGLSGATTCSAAVMSIVRNDPSWILLDLILPG